MNEQETIAHFTEETKECLAKAAQIWPDIAYDLSCTEIVFNIRGGGKLGQARYKRVTRETTIRYNTKYAVANAKAFSDTVPHEVAHIVCMLRDTDWGHGLAWRNTCRLLGGNASRTCNARSFPGVERIKRGTRYFRWEGVDGGRWFDKETHTNLTKCEWSRKYHGYDTFKCSQVMSKDEFFKSLEADLEASKAYYRNADKAA